jgi:hypothetical protein
MRTTRFAGLSAYALLAALAATTHALAPEPSADRKTAPAATENPGAAPTQTPPAAPPLGGLGTDEFAPNGQPWLVDAEGKQYWVHRLPKTYAYRRVAENRVRIGGGLEFEVVGEEPEALLLKVLRQKSGKVARPETAKAAPTAAELATVAATYDTSISQADRMELAPMDRGLPTRGHWRNGFDVADLNGDQRLDIVHGPPRKAGDQLRVFAGVADGSWRPWAIKSPSGILDYGDVRVADMNLDGNLDIVAAVHLRGVLVLLGDGRGGFSVSPAKGLDFKVPIIGEAAPNFSSRHVELVDWNKDGRMDILALSEGPTLGVGGTRGAAIGQDAPPREIVEYSKRGPRLYLNQNDGNFKAVEPPAAAADLFGDDLAVADFDGDGAADFVTGTKLMGVTSLAFRNTDPAGGFEPIEIPGRPRSYVQSVAAGDVNGDRRADILLSYTSFEHGVDRSGIDALLTGPNGTWSRKPLVSREGRRSFEAIDIGDVDGDAAKDVAALDLDGNFFLFLGDGKGGFTAETSPEAQQPRGRCRGYEVRFVDLDADGADELIAEYADEPVALYEPDRCVGNGGIAAWKGRRRD